MRSSIFYIEKISKDRYQFNQVYRIKIDSMLVHSNYGTYENGIFHKTSNLSALEDRRNLNGTQVIVGTVFNTRQSIDLYHNYS